MVQLQPFANWNILQYVVQSRRCDTLELEIFYFHLAFVLLDLHIYSLLFLFIIFEIGIQ